MLDFKSYREINSKAIQSIKTDSDGELIDDKFNKFIFYLLFYGIPLSAFCLVFYNQIKISLGERIVATGISIFTGLFFSLLLNISSRIRIEKENINIDFDSFKRYKNSMKQIANIILYIISLGIYIISLLLINHLVKDSFCKYVEISITAVIFFFGFKILNFYTFYDTKI